MTKVDVVAAVAVEVEDAAKVVVEAVAAEDVEAVAVAAGDVEVAVDEERLSMSKILRRSPHCRVSACLHDCSCPLPMLPASSMYGSLLLWGNGGICRRLVNNVISCFIEGRVR